MCRSLNLRSERWQANKVAYNEFIRQSHLGALTLVAFFLPLVAGAFWLVLTRSNHLHDGLLSDLLLIPSALLISTHLLYGIVGLFLGRRSARIVLTGALTPQATVTVTVAAYMIMIWGVRLFYYILHFQTIPSPNATLSLERLIDVVASCVFIPISEEVAFQGYVQTRLQALGAVPAVLVTTLLFIVIHITVFTGIPTLSNMGHFLILITPALLTFSIVRQITGSLLAVIVLHSLANIAILFPSGFPN